MKLFASFLAAAAADKYSEPDFGVTGGGKWVQNDGKWEIQCDSNRGIPTPVKMRIL